MNADERFNNYLLHKDADSDKKIWYVAYYKGGMLVSPKLGPYILSEAEKVAKSNWGYYSESDGSDDYSILWNGQS